MNGTPKEVVQHPELMEVFLPILKSDFKLSEEYIFTETKGKIDQHITIIFGEEDSINIQSIHAWSDVTTGSCEFIQVAGGHFYITQNPDLIYRIVIIKNEIHRSDVFLIPV
ncbi:thioesterase II family protein [Paenibacillus peoriae]|nr:thioesterase domain-containing protein [Paenibacillus peoriae]